MIPGPWVNWLRGTSSIRDGCSLGISWDMPEGSICRSEQGKVVHALVCHPKSIRSNLGERKRPNERVWKMERPGFQVAPWPGRNLETLTLLGSWGGTPESDEHAKRDKYGTWEARIIFLPLIRVCICQPSLSHKHALLSGWLIPKTERNDKARANSVNRRGALRCSRIDSCSIDSLLSLAFFFDVKQSAFDPIFITKSTSFGTHI